MASALLQEPIIIVGGGTFGTSTAYHLAKRGYTSVTVLDRWAPPSQEAAGNDINKIVRTAYPQPLYATLANEATSVWKDDQGLFAGLFHQSGWILGAGELSKSFMQESIATQKQLGLDAAAPISLPDLRARCPALTGNFDDFDPYWDASPAWVNAAAALKRMADAAAEAGVKYVSGVSGHVVELLYDESSACTGVKTLDGTVYRGSHVIAAAGAAAGSLIDLKGQIVAMGHTVCHIQLTPEEVEKYKTMPIMCHLDGGIFFPPQEDGIMKVTAGSFVTNYAPSHPGVSLPRYSSENPSDGIPQDKDESIRKYLRDIVPEIAERPWAFSKFCWDGDTTDYHFLITPQPDHKNLTLAIGGSAHGFKFLPIIGKYIVDLVEGTLDPQTAEQWKWRPGHISKTPAAHTLPLEDLNDLPGWK